MLVRVILVGVALLLAGATGAQSQELEGAPVNNVEPPQPAPLLIAQQLAPAALPALAVSQSEDAVQIAPALPVEMRRAAAPAWMTGVHAVTIALQALDGHTTIQGLDRGVYEVNPLVQPFAGNKAALIGLKAAVAASVVTSTHALSRRHKVAALATAIAINGVYAAVVAHNYRVLNRYR